jgi:antitoxin CptB
MNGLELRRKRAIYRANHRGTKELDIVLGRFAMACVGTMDEERLTAFEQLLVLPDPDIDCWIRGAKPSEGVAAAVAEVRIFLGLMD